MKDDSKHLDDGGGFAAVAASQRGVIVREERLVRELGADIGFGRIMQLCESEWRKYLAARGEPTGGEFTSGPCAALMMPCQCVSEAKPELDANGHCDWCCGVGRVTKRVRGAQLEQYALRRAADDIGAKLRDEQSRRAEIRVELDKTKAERDSWKRRAAKHGCDIEKGDPDCG